MSSTQVRSLPAISRPRCDRSTQTPMGRANSKPGAPETKASAAINRGSEVSVVARSGKATRCSPVPSSETDCAIHRRVKREPIRAREGNKGEFSGRQDENRFTTATVRIGRKVLWWNRSHLEDTQ